MTNQNKRLEDSSRPSQTLHWLNRAKLDFPAGKRAPAGYVLLALVVASYVLIVFNGPNTLTLDRLPDPQSWTRAVLLRDALETGSWRTNLSRNSSGYGTSLHWTRLVEILALPFVLLLEPFLGRDGAILAVATLFGPVLFGSLTAALLVGRETLRRVEAGNVVRPGRRRHGAGAASIRRSRSLRPPPYHSSLRRHGTRTCGPGRFRPRRSGKFGHLCGPVVRRRDRLLGRNVALCPSRFRGARTLMGTGWERGGCRPRGGMSRLASPSSRLRPGCSIRQTAGFSRSRWIGFRFPTSYPEWVLDWLVTALPITPPVRRRVLVPALAWQLGDLHIGGTELAVVFAIGMCRQSNLGALASAISPAPPADFGIVLTTSAAPQRPLRLPHGYQFLDLREIARLEKDYLAIDKIKLVGWIKGLRKGLDKPAQLTAGRPSDAALVDEVFREHLTRKLPMVNQRTAAEKIRAEIALRHPERYPPAVKTIERHLSRMIKVKYCGLRGAGRQAAEGAGGRER